MILKTIRQHLRTKDFSWMGAPAFLLIVCMIFFSIKKQPFKARSERDKTELVSAQKNLSK